MIAWQWLILAVFCGIILGFIIGGVVAVFNMNPWRGK